MSAPPAGTRLRCARCGSEAIVIKSNGAELVCCGEPLDVTFAPAAKPTDK